MNIAGVQDPGILLLLIGVAALIFGYLYFRRPSRTEREERTLQQIELKLKGDFSPAEIRVEKDRPVQILIHRFDVEPEDEIFEIEELQIYELLPAGHTTVIAFLPERAGSFKLVLGGERTAGMIHIVN